jgi:hypothetical protein
MYDYSFPNPVSLLLTVFPCFLRFSSKFQSSPFLIFPVIYVLCILSKEKNIISTANSVPLCLLFACVMKYFPELLHKTQFLFLFFQFILLPSSFSSVLPLFFILPLQNSKFQKFLPPSFLLVNGSLTSFIDRRSYTITALLKRLFFTPVY